MCVYIYTCVYTHICVYTYVYIHVYICVYMCIHIYGRRQWHFTERLRFHFSLSCIGEGNGNPLQCSCLENPMDGEAWWAAVHGVAQSWTRLKRLSSSSIHLYMCVYTYTYVYIHIYTYIHVFMCLGIHVYLCVGISICV